MGFITKFNITEYCDFGSQMTQYAALVAIGKKTGLQPVFIQETLNGKLGFPLNEPFSIPLSIHSLEDIQNEELYEVKIDYTIEPDNSVFLLSPDKNYVINELFLTFNYFHDVEKEIIKTFTFKKEIIQFCTNYINQIKSSEEEIIVGIHFRRGDYLVYSTLNLSLNYYYEAVKTIQSLFPNKKIKFLIFSNGMEWVKENFKVDNCTYIESLDRFKDMCLMSLCDHIIIANSSFSWWGAYLNKNSNKKIICPYYYLNSPELNGIINGRYFPKEWISLNVC
jgi:hypothetical protein